MYKLKKMRHTLFEWSCAGTSNSARWLQDLNLALRSALAQQQVDWTEVRRLEGDRARAKAQEEKYWKQKHPSNWLLLGDKNTKFFHRSVRAGQKRKRSDCLERPDGSLALTEPEKGNIAVDFYKTLFTSEMSSNMVDLRPLHITPSITAAMNSILLKDVSDSEIRSTVFAISPTKASGPDGFTGLFFQKYWDIIQSDVSRAIQDFFRSNRMLPLFDPRQRYLDLPCIVLRSKQETFQFLEDQVSLRLSSWKQQCLSPAGIHTLLKSVISGLPVYAMSCYRLPDQTCIRLNGLMGWLLK
ncbi:hypothetical protein LINPERHAP1_LOCUS28371 [Linum perenne]